eukprot:TRINITY_DN926_c1_g1_i2.p1 TRINITY_DN926_c1_g1~~TRINITY_DN926_c1_g1_i2.p1  ORF type:complete len:115 (-),score=27.37 TRINITY_DN926_c1_g1_i2:174-518(-)
MMRVLAIALCLFGAAEALGTEGKLDPASLRDQMRSMMDDDGDDDQDYFNRGKKNTKEEDPYLKESADSLSHALGPRWNKDKLEADAKKKTDAFLNGISGNKALGSLNHMLRGLR